MKSKSRIVRYSLGKITVSADLNSFLADPAGLLQRHRSFNGTINWSSGEGSSISDTEQDAERIIDFAQKRYPENYIQSGIEPLKSIHGLAFYEKFLMMEFDEPNEESFYKQLSVHLEVETIKLKNWLLDRRKEKIRGIFW